jgi:hypothetical protein
MPAVRAIVKDAARNEYRMSSFINGVIKSAAFQMGRAPAEESRAAEPASR